MEKIDIWNEKVAFKYKDSKARQSNVYFGVRRFLLQI